MIDLVCGLIVDDVHQVDTAAGKVYLWIGANTLVEFTFDEAIELLQNQLDQSKVKLAELDEDLFFLRGNSITVEVNMARLFNYNVKLKKAAAAATASESPNASQS